METCQRCGEEGEDRRTLWMACFYKMSELDLPFESKTLFHVDNQTLALAKPPSDLVLDDGTSIRIQAGTVTSEGELYPQQFYTLRVCKQCRYPRRIQRSQSSSPYIRARSDNPWNPLNNH